MGIAGDKKVNRWTLGVAAEARYVIDYFGGNKVNKCSLRVISVSVG